MTRAKGVGPKLAQKIILELKDKLNSYSNIAPSKNKGVVGAVKSQNSEDAQMVLLSLGYEKDEVNNAISASLKTVSADATAEDILREALKVLSM